MKLKLLSIKENKDGAELVVEMDSEYKESVKKIMGWERWSDKKYQKYFLKRIKELLSQE